MKDSSLMSRIGFFKKYFQPITNITPKYVEIWVNFQKPKNCVAIINYLSSIVIKDIELRTGSPEPHIVRCGPFFVYVIYWRLQRSFVRETSTNTIPVILKSLSCSFLRGFKILTAKTWRTFYGNKSLRLFWLLLLCCFVKVTYGMNKVLLW